MLFTLEELDINQLIKVLDRQQTMIHEALDPKTTVDFREQLSYFPLFRERITDCTETLLYKCLEYPLNLSSYLHQLDKAVSHSLGTCVLQLDPDDEEDAELRVNDAYRYKYLVNYISFLKYYHEILERYSEMPAQIQVVNTQPQAMTENPVSGTLSPGVAGTQNPLLNLPPATEQRPIPNFSDTLFNNSEQQKEEDRIAKDTKAVYRIAVYIGLMERGGKKFFDSLGITEQFELLGEIIGCKARYVRGNVNDEDSIRYKWRNHVPAVNAFFKELQKIRKT